MGIQLWNTIGAKANMLKCDIKLKVRNVETKKEIREINEHQYKNNKVCTVVKVRTKDELKYHIKVKSTLIHIEGELYDILKKENLERNIKQASKTLAKVGGTTGVVGGILTGFASPYTIPVLLSATFLGIISKSEFDNYDYKIEEINNRIVLTRIK